MDNQLIHHISRLLQAYDCVTVPGLGALILRTEPAVISAGGLMQPPRRRVLFCRDMNHNDGLLVRAYVRSEGVTRNQAEKALRADIDTLLEQLQSDEGISIPAVGMLHYNQEGQLNFTPALRPSYLPTLQLDSVLDMVNPDRPAAPLTVEYTPARSGMAKTWRRVKIAASIAVLLAIGMAVSTPIPTREAQHASPVLQQFAPRAAQPSAADTRSQAATPRSQVAASSACRAADDANIAAAAPQSVSPQSVGKPTAPVTNTQNIANTPANVGKDTPANIGKDTPANVGKAGKEEAGVPRLNPNDAYCLVVASLPDAEAAAAFVAKSGRPMMVFQADGRYRVYALTAATKADLQRNSARLGLKTKYPTAWVCAL